MSSPRATALAVALAGMLVLALSACGSSSSSGKRHAHGSVSAIYAGSLVALMEDHLGPAFERASGYGFSGYGGGSTEDASEIKGGVRQADVFVSASPEADKLLEGAANGSWVSWYATFARSPLVLGYDRSTRYGRELAAGKPWYEVLLEPGILVGRSDPKLDPKGALTLAVMQEASKEVHEPLVQRLSAFPVYPETAFVGRLQAGELDAGFFYADEADAAHIPTVSLAPAKGGALYTATVLKGASNPDAAAAFVKYMLSASGEATLKSSGLEPLAPAAFSGSKAAVPASLRSAVGAG